MDRIELALLNLIVDWHDPVGPTQLESTVAVTIGPVSDREVLDALLALYEDGHIQIGRYVGTSLVQYKPEEGTGYFYGAAFRCTPRPKARRRQQELSSSDRRGVFISHISEEKPIALRIQKLLQDALSSSAAGRSVAACCQFKDARVPHLLSEREMTFPGRGPSPSDSRTGGRPFSRISSSIDWA